MQHSAHAHAEPCCIDEKCATETSHVEATHSSRNHAPPKSHTLFKASAPADVEKQINNLQNATFTIAGMDCSRCAKIAARAFESIPGVRNTSVTFIAGTANCDIDISVTNITEVMRLVERATKYKVDRLDVTYLSLNLLMDQKSA